MIDTNVLFAALYSQQGASHEILRLVINEDIVLALSPQVYFEYEDVLTRQENLNRFALSPEQIIDVLDLLALLARKHEVYFLLRPNLRDETDNIFMECAFVSGSTYLITSNVRDFHGGELTGFSFDVVTPREFYTRWRISHE